MKRGLTILLAGVLGASLSSCTASDGSPVSLDELTGFRENFALDPGTMLALDKSLGTIGIAITALAAVFFTYLLIRAFIEQVSPSSAAGRGLMLIFGSALTFIALALSSQLVTFMITKILPSLDEIIKIYGWSVTSIGPAQAAIGVTAWLSTFFRLDTVVMLFLVTASVSFAVLYRREEFFVSGMVGLALWILFLPLYNVVIYLSPMLTANTTDIAGAGKNSIYLIGLVILCLTATVGPTMFYTMIHTVGFGSHVNVRNSTDHDNSVLESTTNRPLLGPGGSSKPNPSTTGDQPDDGLGQNGGTNQTGSRASSPKPRPDQLAIRGPQDPNGVNGKNQALAGPKSPTSSPGVNSLGDGRSQSDAIQRLAGGRGNGNDHVSTQKPAIDISSSSFYTKTSKRNTSGGKTFVGWQTPEGQVDYFEEGVNPNEALKQTSQAILPDQRNALTNVAMQNVPPKVDVVQAQEKSPGLSSSDVDAQGESPSSVQTPVNHQVHTSSGVGVSGNDGNVQLPDIQGHDQSAAVLKVYPVLSAETFVAAYGARRHDNGMTSEGVGIGGQTSGIGASLQFMQQKTSTGKPLPDTISGPQVDLAGNKSQARLIPRLPNPTTPPQPEEL